MKNIGIIHAGPANYKSIYNAVKKTGNNPIFIKDTKVKENITHLILPGVGSFGAAIKSIKEKKLIRYILNHLKSEKFLLGICVGYQILFTKSTENPKIKGLNLFKGEFENLNKTIKTVPNIGWHQTYFDKKIVRTLDLPYKNASLYYAHTYYAKKYNKKEMYSFIYLQKKKIPVVIMKKNIIGVQFHPEKSGTDGIKFLSSFCNLKD